MDDFVEVGRIGELDEGAMKEVMARGRKLLLARVGDSYYVVDNVCPHMKAKLSDGELEGVVVTCPRHGSQFNLADGRVARWTNMPSLLSAIAKVFKPPRPLNTYVVKLEGDKILIGL